VRVTVTDLEVNGTWSRDLTVAKTVERKMLKKGQTPISTRVNSYGDRVFIVEATDDEVGVKEAAAVSKAARTLILRLVPGHIQDEALALCKQIASDRDAKDPDAARVRILDAFSGIGVTPVDLEQYLGHSTEKITPAEVERLRKVYSAVSTDETTWQDALDASVSARQNKPQATATDAATTAAPSSKSGKGTSAVKDQLKKQAAPAAEETKKESPPADVVEQKCAKCGVPIEPGPVGAQCYACDQS
jgi:hypothetical protein